MTSHERAGGTRRIRLQWLVLLTCHFGTFFLSICCWLVSRLNTSLLDITLHMSELVWCLEWPVLLTGHFSYLYIYTVFNCCYLVTGCNTWPLVQFSSIQFKMVSVLSEKPICAPPRLSEFSPASPLNRFQCSSDWRWPSHLLSMEIVKRFLFPRLSPPGDRWCDVLGFVPAGSVSNSSTLKLFQEASHLWGLHCPPVCLLVHFPPLWHVQGSTSTGVFEGGRRPLTHSGLGFPFPRPLAMT